MKAAFVVVVLGVLGAVLSVQCANWLAIEGRRDGADFDER